MAVGMTASSLVPQRQRCHNTDSTVARHRFFDSSVPNTDSTSSTALVHRRFRVAHRTGTKATSKVFRRPPGPLGRGGGRSVQTCAASRSGQKKLRARFARPGTVEFLIGEGARKPDSPEQLQKSENKLFSLPTLLSQSICLHSKCLLLPVWK